MPITIKVAAHDANLVGGGLLGAREKNKSSQAVLMNLAASSKDIGSILETRSGQQTSLTQSRLRDMRLIVQEHGLVRAAFHAYSDHHHLVLRPEDIWFSILSQFSFFVNNHAEELRSSFVPHEGKKGLIVKDPNQPDMGLMCRNMTRLIEVNIKDPKLREWILPSFTTTTIDDEVVASVIMMGTLQKYFDYVFDASCCGLPSVTLLGEQSDWEDIELRIEKLTEFGEEPTRFCEFLRPVLRNMVASFKLGPEDATVVDFWSRIIDHQVGSGMDKLTGWMVAFCFWDENGRLLAHHERSTDWLSYDYHGIDFNQVPCAFVSVPVTYISPDEKVFNTKLLAGLVGFEVTSLSQVDIKTRGLPQKETSTSKYKDGGSQPKKPKGLIARITKKLNSGKGKDQKPSDTGGHIPATAQQPSDPKNSSGRGYAVPGKPTASDERLNTVQPVTGWWMYHVKGDSDTGQSKGEFYAKKLEEWNGQVSTGYVRDGGATMVVEQELPRD